MNQLDYVSWNASYKTIDRAVLDEARKELLDLLYSRAPRTRQVVATRIAQIEMAIAELDGFPIHVECEFDWTVDEEEVEALAKVLGAPLLACRAGCAWVCRAEASPNDFSFFEGSIFDEAGYCASSPSTLPTPIEKPPLPAEQTQMTLPLGVKLPAGAAARCDEDALSRLTTVFAELSKRTLAPTTWN